MLTVSTSVGWLPGGHRFANSIDAKAALKPEAKSGRIRVHRFLRVGTRIRVSWDQRNKVGGTGTPGPNKSRPSR